ncbi:MAG: helix-turn-helix domain-containing protein [Synechocystis sp.]|nr:helix-turn-helix domain-containing protein [Synechocystis sp.]
MLRPCEQKVLEKIVRSHKSEQRLVRRAQIVLKANEGQSNVAIAQTLGLNRETVIRWRQRWSEEAEGLPERENKEGGEVSISEHIHAILMDKPRPGAPVTFSAEQVVRIVAMACEDPQTDRIPGLFQPHHG